MLCAVLGCGASSLLLLLCLLLLLLLWWLLLLCLKGALAVAYQDGANEGMGNSSAQQGDRQARLRVSLVVPRGQALCDMGHRHAFV